MATIAFVEYIGKFLGLVSHGNSYDNRKFTHTYLRTPYDVCEEDGRLIKTFHPKAVYNRLILDTSFSDGVWGSK